MELECHQAGRSRPIGIRSMTEPKTQLDKFKQAARELETDDDPERFKERLGKLVNYKPVEKNQDN